MSYRRGRGPRASPASSPQRARRRLLLRALPAPAVRGDRARRRARVRRWSRVFAPWVAPYGPTRRTSTRSSPKPSLDHLLGTDELGRDILSRIIWGARASIQAGVLATLLAIVIAVPIGLVAGYYRGWIDPVISRITDVLLAFPFLILAVGLAAILGPSLLNATIAIGIGAVPGLIRDHPRRDARAAGGGLRPRRGRERRVRPRHPGRHIVPNMTQHAARAGDGDDSRRDHRRGGALVPRPRRPAADAVLGRDARRRAGVPRPRRRGSRSTPASRSSSARSRSTCSATACATSSTRGRGAERDAAARRRATSRCGSRPTTARRRRSTGSRSRSRPARCSGSSASRAAARASRSMAILRLLADSAVVSGDGFLRGRRPARRARRAPAAGSADARSPSSSRSR